MKKTSKELSKRFMRLAQLGIMGSCLLMLSQSGFLSAEVSRAAAETKNDSITKNAGGVILAGASSHNSATPQAVPKETSMLKAPVAGKILPINEKNVVDQEYIFKKGDRIKITIYPEDEVIKGATMEISSEGTITLPLMGKVEVAGKSAVEAQKTIAEILDKDYLVNPEVVIEVAEKFSSEKDKVVVLLGQVRSPGSHAFPKTGHFTLLQAIAVAGGFSDVANIKKIKIIRGGAANGKVIRANADEIISGTTPDIDLEDGDIINVAESIF